MKSNTNTRKKSFQTTVGFFVSLLLFLFGVGLSSTPASSQMVPGEKILNFRTTITVSQDSSIHVVESIEYDFDSLQKHGIYRDIPVKYSTSLGSQSISLSDISVTDELGNPYQFTISNIGNNKQIKIGDPSKTITGVHTYVVGYTISRAIGYFDSYDEIYWNATGNEWKVPILYANAIVILPKEIPVSRIRFSCYVGPIGSNAPCKINEDDDIGIPRKQVVFQSPHTLEAGSGLTVAVGFPKRLVSSPSTTQKVFSFIADNLIVLSPLLVFLTMFILWWRKGRDPKGSGVIVAEYDSPDNLSPLEVEAILHTKLRASSISAEIVHLAVRGYITITRIEETRFLIKSVDYELHLVKEYIDIQNEFDKILLDGLFGSDKVRELLAPILNIPENSKIRELLAPVLTIPETRVKSGTIKISDLKNTFYKHIPKIQKSVFETVTSKGYYLNNPEKILKKYVTYPLSVFLVILFFAFQTGFMGGAVLVSGAISVVIVLLFGLLMPAKTAKGALVKDRILGLKEYLQIAEKDRINFHNAPEKNPKLFEKLLPFAMILGVEKTWAKEFEGMYTAEPSWYHDPYHAGMFNAIALSDGLHGFSGIATSSLSTAPGGSSGSGGGGFSGGGGGGGGGGSW